MSKRSREGGGGSSGTADASPTTCGSTSPDVTAVRAAVRQKVPLEAKTYRGLSASMKSSVSAVDKTEVCVFCLEKTSPGDLIIQMKCCANGPLCYICINGSLSMRGRHSCLVCQTPLAAGVQAELLAECKRFAKRKKTAEKAALDALG
jgi:hypothetical protein